MSVEVPKMSGNGGESAAGALTYSPLREMLGYDPFRRFFSNVDPQIDVIRTDAGFDVEIPVPGFRTDQIEIVVKENILTVTGKSERRAFTRSLKLPEDVDTQTIEASVENGLLSLSLKRHPEAQPRRIEIQPRSS
jgi:HSP20 family molecular chaperone IbpA